MLQGLPNSPRAPVPGTRPGPKLPEFQGAPALPSYGLAALPRFGGFGPLPTIPTLGPAPTIGYNPTIEAPGDLPDIRSMVAERDAALEEWGRRRLQPQFEEQREDLHTRLVNRGLMPGSEGFSRSLHELSTAEGDALAGLMLQGREAERQLAYQQAAQNQEMGRWGLAANTEEARLRLQKALEEAGLTRDYDFRQADMGMTRAEWEQERALTGAGFDQERDLARFGAQQDRYRDLFDAERARRMAEWGMGYTHMMTPYHAQLDRDLAMLDSETARHVSNLAARGGASAASMSAASRDRSSMMGGLFGLGSTIISGAFGLSDPRFKRNAKVVGKGYKGLSIYEYKLGNRTERGYMADEVMEVEPEAVVHGPGGYMMLNYAKLGGRPHAV